MKRPVFFTIIFLVLTTLGFCQENTVPAIRDSAITLADFNNRIGNHEKAVLVYFSADWCAVCEKMKPIMDQIESDCAGKMIVLKIDTERDKEVTAEFEIDALPVFMLYKNGCTEWIHVGLLTLKLLHSEIDPFLNSMPVSRKKK